MLDLLKFSDDELENVLLLGTAAMHADNRIRIEEKGILALIKALVEIAWEEAEPELKEEWEEKVKKARRIVEKNVYRDPFEMDEDRIKGLFKNRKKQRIVLALLLKIISADRHVDKREIDFVIVHIARVWGYSAFAIVKFIESRVSEFALPEELLYMIKVNYIYHDNGESAS